MNADRLVIDRDLRENLEYITIVFKISRIDDCNVKRIGSLEFDFSGRSCNTYPFEVEKILFCFGTDEKECHL